MNKKTPFVIKLNDILLKRDLNAILSFCEDGTSFIIHKQEEFTNEVLPMVRSQTTICIYI
jgi:hypothetical protein